MRDQKVETPKAYKQWQGDNIFFCKGKLMIG